MIDLLVVGLFFSGLFILGYVLGYISGKHDNR